MNGFKYPIIAFFALALFLSACPLLASEDDDPLVFDDYPLRDPLEYPSWFKETFLDLQEDLQDALAQEKKGLIVYFGQKRCPYCHMLLKGNWGQAEIASYTQKHFNVVPVDIWSIEEVTDPKGETLTQREYALRENTDFTPSLLFYDKNGDLVMKLRGYYPPYQFMAALQYVVEEHYKRESFKVYLARGDQTLRFEKDDMVEQDFFSPPPYNLDRRHFRAERPLVVFFERGDCHACDILHTQPLKHLAVVKLFDRFESIQLNMDKDTPVITPSGQKTTARQWADELDIFYAPSMVFFDENGQEIIRVDSVVRFFRLRSVLNYILSGSYKNQPIFQIWRSQN